MGLKNTGRQCTVDSFAAHDLKGSKPVRRSFSDVVLNCIVNAGRCSLDEVKRAKKARSS